MLAVSAIAILVVVLMWFATLRHKSSLMPQELPKSSWVWSCCFFGALLVISALRVLGLVNESSRFAWPILCLVLVIGAWVSLWRHEVRELLGSVSFSWILEFILLAVCSYLTFVAIELPSNANMMEFDLVGMNLEIFLIFLVLAAGHFMFQRSGVGPALGVLAFLAAGIAEYFVVTFKGTPIMASDVLAIGTAAAVGGDYTYLLSDNCIFAMSLAALIVLMLSLSPLPAKQEKRTFALNIGLSLAIIFGTASWVFFSNFATAYGVYINGFHPLRSYNREGFVTSFITSAQELRPRKPRGYKREQVEQEIAEYAQEYDITTGSDSEMQERQRQFDELHPNMIFVMNETFADLSIFDELHVGYTGPEFLHNFDEALLSGDTYVSVFGGGTCNSEWELLTGLTTGYMSAGVYPYMVYKLDALDNLARQFSNLGYTTTALHPNLARNWNRDVAYRELGFTSFESIGDFAGAERLRGKVTDKATYDRILELIRECDEPQFILDVTMQNHSPYDTGLLPKTVQVNYALEGEENPITNEYLAVIAESDRALEQFVNQLRWLDEPCVLVFFGDHQPSLSRLYMDYLGDEYEQGSVGYYEQGQRTPYFVWANYDVVGSDTGNTAQGQTTKRVQDTSPNYLGAQALQAVGAPLSDFQKMQLMVSRSLPIVNLVGYQDMNGGWHEIASKDNIAKGSFELMRKVQYYELFRDGVRYQLDAGQEGFA